MQKQSLSRAATAGGAVLRWGQVAPWIVVIAGCVQPDAPPARPDVRPTVSPPAAESLPLDASHVEPMYVELLPIDLPTVVTVAMADNVDLRLARYQVEQDRGRLQSAVGGAFPVVAPLALFEHVDGSVRATEGDIVNVGFNTFQPSIALQWVLNPGQVVYEIIAARRRLDASGHRESAVRQETLRRAAEEYYELVFAQARIVAAHQAVQEAEELVRINELRARAGAGVPADEMRAQARLAERQQDLAVALNALYRASLALTRTLQLEDPTVTLIPKADQVASRQLVDDRIDVHELLAHAVAHRPDLKAVRDLIEAAAADHGATWWRGFGPQFAATYQYGGITGHSNNTDKGQGIPPNLIVNPLSAAGTFSGNPVANAGIREGILRGSRRLDRNRDESFAFSDQQRVSASVGARWGLSAFGDLKAASAAEQQAILEAERALLAVKTEVIQAAQASRLNRQLIGMAKRQVTAAEEALRLTEANLQAGTLTTIDVLQAQDAVAQARLRYAEAVVRYNQAEVNLLASLGLLDVASLNP